MTNEQRAVGKCNVILEIITTRPICRLVEWHIGPNAVQSLDDALNHVVYANRGTERKIVMWLCSLYRPAVSIGLLPAPSLIILTPVGPRDNII